MTRKTKSIGLRAGSFLLDMAVATAAFIAAYAIVYDFHRLPLIPSLSEKAVAFVGISAVTFFLFGVHRGSWRFVSLPEVLNLLKAAIAAVVVYTVSVFLVSRGHNVPRSVPLLTAFFMIAGLIGPRILYRLAVEGQLLPPLGGKRPEDGVRHVIVLGFTTSADSFIRNSRRIKNSPFVVAGILDGGGLANSQSIQGVPVFGGLDVLPALVDKFAAQNFPITELVVAENEPGRQRLSEIVELATASGLKTTRIPGPTETAAIGSDGLFEPKPIELGDLLGRPEIKTDIEGVAGLIAGRTVLATGAGGSIGSELVRQIAQFCPKRLILTDNSEHNTYLLDTEIREKFPELDIVTQLVSVRDKRRLDNVFETYRPDVVFHAAALKHVPLVEDNPIEGIKTNVLGTRNAADAAVRWGASTFVMISTDKAVNPTNIMGASKRAAEAYCQAMDVSAEGTRFKTVRFGNVLGSNGSVVPRFREQIAAGGPVTVTHPQIVRFFMTIPEAVRLVLHASAHALQNKKERGRIMVLDMGKPVRIVDLAERMIQLAGFKPHVDIEIAYTGLRPGEKLYEELFDPDEVQDMRTEDGYVVASPRVIDASFLLRTLKNLEVAAEEEDSERAIQLLLHIVPEYRPGGQTKALPVEQTLALPISDKAVVTKHPAE
ncbi:polysaccharide biosynthesis protein [Aliihoeflea sp. PC F10.4]